MSAVVKSTLVGFLAVTCAASSSGAAEFGQSSTSGDGSPVIAFPAFLDMSRLPDLQEAWRARAAQVPAEPVSAPEAIVQPAVQEDGGPSPDPASDAAIQSARATLVRAEKVSRDADAVRLRAEELSSRFGAGESQSPTTTGSAGSTDQGAVAETPVAEDPALTSTAAAEPVKPENEPAAAKVKPAPTEPASIGGDASADQPRKRNDDRTLMRAGLTPPSAGRASTAARKPAEPTRTIVTTTPAASKQTPVEDQMPMEIRAFGWNSQP
jgi:hypothetical protein